MHCGHAYHTECAEKYMRVTRVNRLEVCVLRCHKSPLQIEEEEEDDGSSGGEEPEASSGPSGSMGISAKMIAQAVRSVTADASLLSEISE